MAAQKTQTMGGITEKEQRWSYGAITEEELRWRDSVITCEERYKLSFKSAAELAYLAAYKLYYIIDHSDISDEVAEILRNIAAKAEELYERLKSVAETMRHEAELIKKKYNKRNRIYWARKIISLINEKELKEAKNAIGQEAYELLRSGMVTDREARLYVWWAILALHYIDDKLDEAVCRLAKTASRMLIDQNEDNKLLYSAEIRGAASEIALAV